MGENLGDITRSIKPRYRVRRLLAIMQDRCFGRTSCDTQVYGDTGVRALQYGSVGVLRKRRTAGGPTGRQSIYRLWGGDKISIQLPDLLRLQRPLEE
jgi:hypothetical protein